MANGAQINLKNNDDKTAGEVTSNMVIKQLLIEKEDERSIFMNVDSNNRTKYVTSESDFVPNYLKISSVNPKLILNERSLRVKDDDGLKKTEANLNNPCSTCCDSECEVKILKIRVANGDPDFIETDLTT